MRRICLPLLAVLLVACQDLGPSNPELDTLGISPQLAPGTPITIAGFDQARGQHFGIELGERLDIARLVMETTERGGSALGVTYASFNTLDPMPAAVAAADIMILFSRKTDNSSSQTPLSVPLSPTEQTSLRNFVVSGGCAILVADFDATLDPYWIAANNSLVGAFGMTVAGTHTDFVTANIVGRPTVLTDPPARSVNSLGLLSPGLITVLGPATSIAELSAGPGGPAGPTMALIEPGALAAGSGPVIVVTNALAFADADDLFPPRGRFGENTSLWLNTIDYCVEWDDQGGGGPGPSDPAEMLDDLLEAVNLVAGPDFTEADRDRLIAFLDNAVDNYEVENKDTIDALEDFIDKVSDFIENATLWPELGNLLIGLAQDIIAALIA